MEEVLPPPPSPKDGLARPPPPVTMCVTYALTFTPERERGREKEEAFFHSREHRARIPLLDLLLAIVRTYVRRR